MNPPQSEPPGESVDKIERLINLTACLLETRKPLTFDELKQTVYRGQSKSDNALKRMFERDKEELRDMDIEVETVKSEYEEEPGYMIPRKKYYLPHLDFEHDERVALTMVSRLFLGSGTPFSMPAQLAVLKLAFEKQDTEDEFLHVHWVESPRDSKLLGGILEALLRRKTVSFSYRALASDEAVKREVEPYGLFNKMGAWYFIGLCRLRDDVRCFKLDRIASEVRVNEKNPRTPDFEVPAGFDIREEINWERPGKCAPDMKAKVVFKPRLAFAASTWGSPAGAQKRRADGSLEVTYKVADPDEFVDWVLGFGTDARIASPAALKDLARERLEGVLRGFKSK
jgi:proteasome accessory factor B